MTDIVPYSDTRHRAQVIALWKAAFGYAEAHNDSGLAIDQKLAVADGLFFAAEDVGGQVVGTLLAGYDGHRGWLYSLAVSAGQRGHGIARRLVDHAEAALAVRGCLKINLQVVAGNEAVCGFYAKLGYAAEPRVSMVKRLVGNLPAHRDSFGIKFYTRNRHAGG